MTVKALSTATNLHEIPGYTEACKATDKLMQSIRTPVLTTAAKAVIERWDHTLWKVCRHLRETDQCFGVGHQPGQILCPRCFDLHSEDFGETVCDYCGVEADCWVNLHAVFHAMGPVLVLFVLCDQHVESPGSEMCCAWPRHLPITLRTTCIDRPRF